MPSREVHTRPTEKGWANRAGTYTISRHRKKGPAQQAGRSQAIERQALHVIHRRDGSVGEQHSYG